MNHQTNSSQRSQDELIKDLEDLQNSKLELEMKFRQKTKGFKTLSEIGALAEKSELSLASSLEEMANIITSGWQFPDITCVRITVEDIEYKTANFTVSEWNLYEYISLKNNKKGTIEVYYLQQMPSEDEGPFLKEERILLKLISRELSRIAERPNPKEKPVFLEKKGVQSFPTMIQDEDTLREIFETMQDSYFQADLYANFSFINPTALNMFGYNSDNELIGKPAETLYADRNERKKLMAELKKTGKVTDKSLLGLKKDGSTFWVSMNIQFVYDKDGNIIGTQGVVRDITARKEAEIRSKEHQLQLKNAIEIAGLGFYSLVDDSEKLEYMDEKAASILNIHDGQAKGKTLIDYWISNIHTDDQKEVLAIYKGLDQGETDKALLMYRYIHPQKGWIWIKHIIEKIEKKQAGNKIKKFSVVQDITSLKNAEMSLLENESKFRALSENSLTGVYMLENGHFLYTNQAFNRIFGYSHGELIGKKGNILVHPNDRDLLLKNYKEMILGKASTMEFEMKGMTKDGKTINIMNFERFFTIGSRRLFIGNILDITKNKKYEEKLLSFSRAVEQSPASIIITDVNGNIEYANPFFSKLTGYTSKEYIRKSPGILKSGYHPDAFYKHMWKTIKSGKTWEGEFYNQRKDKSFYWEKAIISPIKNENGEIINFVAIKTDITESKEMTQKLISAKKSSEENRKWFEALFYTSPAYVSITRLNGEYVDVNESFQIVSGYTKEELITLRSADIHVWVNPKDRENMLYALKTTGQVDRMETTFKLRNGQYIFVMVSAKVIDLNNEQLILMVTQDFTQLKEAETELIAAKEKAEESDRLKTAFLLNMSHEIRTPMNGILGFTSLLNEPGLNDDERTQFISLIHKSGERLLNTINDIIEISKIEIGDVMLKLEKINLVELMRFHHKFFNIQAQEKSLDFEITNQITGDDAELITDKSKLDSILMNLIKNAIKFTSTGKIEIGNYLRDGHVWFYVSDTGKGIPKEKQDTIFERFMQVDIGLARGYEGSGIGLSIVKAYLEILGGTIHVSSEIGQGSTFLFSIPYQPINKKTENAEAKPKTNTGSRDRTILIVEDNEINYIFLKAALSKDFSLLHADSGEKAIKLYLDNPEISMILMDIRLVGEYDGIETTRRIREIDQQIPIIAQTAGATDADKNKSLLAGCNDYISKPYSLEQIKSVIQKHLN
ncbi:MAG: histidine kinase [Bacteroidetes bacterium]|nr:histidine kinase [Bacteroidota bacterium]